MKKELKKKIEHEIADAIQKALSGHNSHAIAKTKKAIKEASKFVAKKFVKTLKTIEGKGAELSKAKPHKEVNSKKVKTGKLISVRGANGRFTRVKKKISLSAGLKRKVANPSRLTERR